MKPGELIKVTFMTVSYSTQPFIGIVLSSRKRNTENYFDIKMLCNTGEIREFVGHNDVVERIG